MTMQLNITRIRQWVAIPVDEGWVIAERVWTAATTTLQGEANDQVTMYIAIALYIHAYIYILLHDIAAACTFLRAAICHAAHVLFILIYIAIYACIHEYNYIYVLVKALPRVL